MRIVIYFIGIALLCLCKNARNYESAGQPVLADISEKNAASAPPAPMEQDAVRPEENVATPVLENHSRKIIRDGNMEIRVDDPAVTKKGIDTLVKKYNAYYSNESFNNTDYAHGFTLNIRIPSVAFDQFIAVVEKGEGEVVYKNISSRDVTEEFIDLETRQSNKRKYIDRYGDLLKQAKTVKDILEIQDKTRVIEEELESVEGRLKYLNNQVDFSTLILNINKKNDYNQYSPYKGKFIDRLKMSLVRGWFGFVSFILFVIKIWPFWLVSGGLIYFVRSILRRHKKKV